jgi:hypothetical protein
MDSSRISRTVSGIIAWARKSNRRFFGSLRPPRRTEVAQGDSVVS